MPTTRQNIIRFILLFHSLLICSFAYAESTKTFTLGIVTFPPITLINPETNDCVGTGIDVTKSILNKVGHKIKVVCAPAARIYRMMAQGTVDFTINVKSTRQLQPHTTFVEPRFTTLKLQLIKYINKPILDVAGVRGFDYLGYREKLSADGYEFTNVATAEDAVALFINQRTDALVTYERPFNDYLTNNLNNKLPSDIEVKELQAIGAYYGVSKNSSNHDQLVDYLSNFAIKNNIKEYY